VLQKYPHLSGECNVNTKVDCSVYNLSTSLLTRVRKWVQFYNLGPNVRGGGLRQKFFWAKNVQNWDDFGQLQTSIANIYGTDQDIENRTTLWPRIISTAWRKKLLAMCALVVATFQTPKSSAHTGMRRRAASR